VKSFAMISGPEFLSVEYVYDPVIAATMSAPKTRARTEAGRALTAARVPMADEVHAAQALDVPATGFGFAARSNSNGQTGEHEAVDAAVVCRYGAQKAGPS